MKSWPGGGGSPNSTYKNMPYRLDKLRSALAEAQLKIGLTATRPYLCLLVGFTYNFHYTHIFQILVSVSFSFIFLFLVLV